MNIYLGNTEIAGFLNDWKIAFEELGHNVTTCTDYPNPFYKYKYDFILSEIRENLLSRRPARLFFKYRKLIFKIYSKLLFYYFVNKHDVFIYFGKPFFEDFKDFEILKKRNKKTVFIFVGDEVRFIPKANEEFEIFGLSKLEYPIEFHTEMVKQIRLNLIREVEKNVNVIYGQPNYMQLAEIKYKLLFIPIQFLKLPHKPEQRIFRPTIVHAPSDDLVKGTKYVLDTIKELRSDGLDFEFILVKNISNDEALKIYSNSDIIIDQLFLPGGGKLAYECLAMGKVVMSAMGFESNYNTNLLEIGCPIVNITKYNLKEKVKELIINIELRKNIASLGRKYVEKYHNPKSIAENLIVELDVWNSRNI